MLALLDLASARRKAGDKMNWVKLLDFILDFGWGGFVGRGKRWYLVVCLRGIVLLDRDGYKYHVLRIM